MNFTLLTKPEIANASEAENGTETVEIPVDPQNDFDNLLFILAPLAVLSIIFILSILVYLMATTKKRHRFDREHLIPIYDLEDPNDETEEFNFLIPGQPAAQRKPNYQTNNVNCELYA